MANIDDVYLKLVSAVLILAIALLGARASLDLRSRDTTNWLSIGNCFAGGVFIGAGLLHTLADSQSLFATLMPEVDFPIWGAIAAIAILILMWIDYALSATEARTRASGYTLFIVLSLHSLLAGMALGVEAHPVQATAILLAILAHKGSAAFALGLRTDTRGYWRRMLAFSVMTPLGVGIGSVLVLTLQNGSEALFEAIFDAVAAGTFLYVALGEILPTELKGSKNVHGLSISILLGLALMALIALYA